MHRSNSGSNKVWSLMEPPGAASSQNSSLWTSRQGLFCQRRDLKGRQAWLSL